MEPIKFETMQSVIDPGFWHALSLKKMEKYRLNDQEIEIVGSYEPGGGIQVEGIWRSLPCRLHVSKSSFELTSNERFVAPGWLKNFNTLEDFKSANKNEMLTRKGQIIFEAIADGSFCDNPQVLVSFGVAAYADLKKFRFYHWFMFPALITKIPFTAQSQLATDYFELEIWNQFELKYQRFLEMNPSDAGFFIVQQHQNSVNIGPLRSLKDFADDGRNKIILGFVDPSGLPDTPGWPLRNLLFAMFKFYKLESLLVLCYRPFGKKGSPNQSILLQVSANEDLQLELDSVKLETLNIVGWERNPQDKLAPQVSNLAPTMDPKQLADTSIDLNLKLMRWRIVPELDLDKISKSRCLLLGAGTLGCYIARSLLAWGVRHITFVDSGKISFSNPVRQPLFEFEDCLEGGKEKAKSASNALKRIFPGVVTSGVQLAIPMPGHFVNNDDECRSVIEQLENLIINHDNIFLLMDSRESRWLPTLLSKYHDKVYFAKKLCMTTALGFDSFLVMRHGVKSQPLGCYYCNDVVAPTDSLKDRTLDQQCTVTRPGIAAMAGGVTVELLASVLSHPLQKQASSDSESVLGSVPHQIRGQLSSFGTMILNGAQYDKCTACSDEVIGKYRTEGVDFVLKALKDPKYLEQVVGLDQLQIESEAVDVDWEDDF